MDGPLDKRQSKFCGTIDSIEMLILFTVSFALLQIEKIKNSSLFL